ncbi:MAG: hypothetical protein CFE38_15590 [Comamonadaceae bacterium PBBC1]|nr:MAG: hypothetical protein CFE38_15590 [Comamonadaceae bacterium PBBC1]
MLFKSWAQTIFCFLFDAPLHGAVVGQALRSAYGGAFWQQDMPRPVPLHSPQEGRKKRFDPLR